MRILREQSITLGQSAAGRAVGLGTVWVLAGLLGGCAGAYRADETPSEFHAAEQVLRPLWTRTLAHQGLLSYKPQEWATAAISARGTIYVGSSAQRLLAFRRDGRLLWKRRVGGAISSQPLVHEGSGTLYFGADDGHMYAVDLRTGKQRWSYRTEGTIAHAPAYSEGVLLFTSSENRIYGLDAASGKWRWQYDRERPEGFTIHGFSGVMVHGTLAYTGFSDGMVVALKPATGELAWTRSVADEAAAFVDADATPVMLEGHLLCAGYATGVYALTPDSGSIQWRFTTQGVTAIAAGRGQVYAAAPKTGIVALSAEGQEQWRQAISRGVPSQPVASGDHVLVSASEAGVYVASARTGRLLQYVKPSQGVTATTAVGAGLVVLLSNHGRLYVFEHLTSRGGG